MSDNTKNPYSDFTKYTANNTKWDNNSSTSEDKSSQGILSGQNTDFIKSQFNNNSQQSTQNYGSEPSLDRADEYVNNFVNRVTNTDKYTNPTNDSNSNSNVQNNNDYLNNSNNKNNNNGNYGNQSQPSYTNQQTGTTPIQPQSSYVNPVDTYVPNANKYADVMDIRYTDIPKASEWKSISPSDIGSSLATDSKFDMKQSYGGYNFGNNNPTAGMGGNVPPFTTFNTNGYTAEQANFNFPDNTNAFPTNGENENNPPQTTPYSTQSSQSPIYNYQADNYFNGPFGNMNNAYGGQNLLLNPYAHAGMFGNQSYIGKGMHLGDRVEETLSDRQGQHTDRGVGNVKGGIAQTIAALPINEAVNAYRQHSFQDSVKDYYNKNGIADAYKEKIGSTENMPPTKKP